MPSRLRDAIVALSCSIFVIVSALGSRPLICSSLAGSLGLENEGHWNCSAPRTGNAMNAQSVSVRLNAVLIMTHLLRGDLLYFLGPDVRSSAIGRVAEG